MFNRFVNIKDVKKIEQEFSETMEQIELEKTDTLAMMVAAFVVFIPGLLLIISVFCSLLWLVFLR